MQKKIRIGVFGTWRGAAYIKTLLLVDGAEIVAICDKSKKRIDEALQLTPEGVKVCSDFDELLEIYGEDPGFAEYTNGYYLTAASEYEIAEVKDVLPEMKTGEIRLVQSDYGFHIVKKYELDEGAYKDKTNADFFTDFNDKLMTEMFLNLVGQYTDKVEVDEELASSIEIRDVAANYYY